MLNGKMGCQLLALRYRHPRIEFTFAIRGTADMNGATRASPQNFESFFTYVQCGDELRGSFLL